MGLSDQVRSLASAGATMRREIHGGEDTTGRMTDTQGALPFACYWSADRSGELSVELGFKEAHDFIVRVDKEETSFDPTIGKRVTLTDAEGRTFQTKLTTRADSALNPEYVFGCKNDF